MIGPDSVSLMPNAAFIEKLLPLPRIPLHEFSIGVGRFRISFDGWWVVKWRWWVISLDKVQPRLPRFPDVLVG